MPEPETIAWLQQSAALDGSATSRTLLEVLERLDGLTSLMLRFHPELRDEIAAMFSDAPEPAPCPHIRSSDEGTSYCALAEQQPAPAVPAPAPAGSLVETVAEAIHDEAGSRNASCEARAAILAVADCVEQFGTLGCISVAQGLRYKVKHLC